MKIHVGLFAKPPVPGSVKTRLCPPLSPEQAARLYEAFLVDTARVCAQDPGWTFDVFSPDPERQEAEWPENAPRPRRFRPQRGAHLGERLTDAFVEAFEEGCRRMLILGSDHPTVPPARLRDALDALRWRNVVLGPSLDGGYYLIGMSQPPRPSLLETIPWSTPQVLAATLREVADAGWTAGLIRPWYDVDTPEDLRRLTLDAPGGATAEALARFPEVRA